MLSKEYWLENQFCGSATQIVFVLFYKSNDSEVNNKKKTILFVVLIMM